MSNSDPSLGAYQILGQIGQGGMGAVYRGRHWRSGAEVALKVLRAGQRANPAQRERFRREVEALKRLQHENLLTVLDAGESQAGSPWLAMPLVAGETLDALLARQGTLPIDELWDLASQVSGALAHVHRAGLIHRDLKPENLIRQEVSGLARWVVTDFGLAKDLEVAESQALSKTGAVLGTPGYWAPEQATSRPSGPFSDVYGIGAVLYAAATGVPPIQGATFWEAVVATEHQVPRAPRALRPEVPPALERVILRCLEKDPSARYPSASELSEALDAAEQEGGKNPSGFVRRLGLAALALALVGASALALSALGDTSTEDADPRPSLVASAPEGASPAPSHRPSPLASATPEAAPASPSERAVALKMGLAGEQDLEGAEEVLERALAEGDLEALSELAYLLLRRRGPEVDARARAERAVELLERGAQAGSARAIRGLGHVAREGRPGYPPEPEKARGLYELAASQEDTGAIYTLTALERMLTPRARAWIEQIREIAERGDPNAAYRMYLVQDTDVLRVEGAGRSEEWLQRAAAAEQPRALYELACWRIAKGRSSPAALREGLDLLLRAIRAGEHAALTRYGVFLVHGEAGPPDLVAGLRYLRWGARLGDPVGMRNLGIALQKRSEADQREALFWARQAYEAGDRKSTLILGMGYYDGLGVPVDRTEGYRWLSEAARLGLPRGRHAVAVAKLTGGGTLQDTSEGVQILRGLIREDYAMAYATLGQALRDGTEIQADPVEARELLRIASTKGRSEAYIRYAEMAAKGLGGPVDLVEARIWVERALTAGVPGAKAVLRKLEELEASSR